MASMDWSDHTRRTDLTVALPPRRRSMSFRRAGSKYRPAGYLEVGAFNDEPFAPHWFEKRIAP